MTATTLYAVGIQEAIARGDAAEMRRLLSAAEEHLQEWGNMPVAVELLRAELKKAEHRASS